jgi:hypothetical protein
MDEAPLAALAVVHVDVQGRRCMSKLSEQGLRAPPHHPGVVLITAELVYSVHVAIDGVPSVPAIYHPTGMQLHKRVGDLRASLLEHHVFIAIQEPPTVSTDRIRSLPPPPSRSSTYGVRSSRKA